MVGSPDMILSAFYLKCHTWKDEIPRRACNLPPIKYKIKQQQQSPYPGDTPFSFVSMCSRWELLPPFKGEFLSTTDTCPHPAIPPYFVRTPHTHGKKTTAKPTGGAIGETRGDISGHSGYMRGHRGAMRRHCADMKRQWGEHGRT